MYLNNKYREALQWAVTRLSVIHTAEEKPLYDSLCALFETANKAAIKNAEHSREAMEKYRSTPEGRKRNQEIARAGMRKRRAQ